MKLTTSSALMENCINCCNQMEKKSSPWTELDGQSPTSVSKSPGQGIFGLSMGIKMKGEAMSLDWGRCPSCRRMYKRKIDTITPIEEE